MEDRTCAFQYAKIYGDFLRRTVIVHDESLLTLNEAKALWNKYFHDCAKHIRDGNTAEMVIWINMPDNCSYFDKLQHICTDAESDGVSIWETKKTYFTGEFSLSYEE